ncbi:hypothetical protein V8C86DRAFT_2648439 [Haematococcus lacustris]
MSHGYHAHPPLQPPGLQHSREWQREPVDGARQSWSPTSRPPYGRDHGRALSGSCDGDSFRGYPDEQFPFKPMQHAAVSTRHASPPPRDAPPGFRWQLVDDTSGARAARANLRPASPEDPNSHRFARGLDPHQLAAARYADPLGRAAPEDPTLWRPPVNEDESRWRSQAMGPGKAPRPGPPPGLHGSFVDGHMRSHTEAGHAGHALARGAAPKPSWLAEEREGPRPYPGHAPTSRSESFEDHPARLVHPAQGLSSALGSSSTGRPAAGPRAFGREASTRERGSGQAWEREQECDPDPVHHHARMHAPAQARASAEPHAHQKWVCVPESHIREIAGREDALPGCTASGERAGAGGGPIDLAVSPFKAKQELAEQLRLQAGRSMFGGDMGGRASAVMAGSGGYGRSKAGYGRGS